jgi:two-component system response regulator FixJ
MRPMPTESIAFVVDDDEVLRDALCQLLEAEGIEVKGFADGPSFLAAFHHNCGGCVLLDVAMPGMDGMAVQRVLKERGFTIPIIFLTGHGDIPMAVEAIHEGALDFLEKPVPGPVLIDQVRSALAMDRKQRITQFEAQRTRQAHSLLSPREREVFDQVVAGRSNKEIASQLGISHRTVEVHRNNLMRKMDAGSLAELIRLAILCKK